MHELDKNLTIRCCESIGLIGNGHCCAVIDKNGGVEMATVEKRVRDKKGNIIQSSETFENLMSIHLQESTNVDQYFIKDTPILVTKMENATSAIKVYHFYPREINKPAKSLYIQHIEIMKGEPKIKITATPIIDGLPLQPKTKTSKKSKKSKNTNNTRIKYNDFVLRLSEDHIIDKIIYKKFFQLKSDVTMVFGYNISMNVHSETLNNTSKYWVNRCEKLTIPKKCSQSLQTEMKRAYIQLSHCQSLKDGIVLRSAVRKMLVENNPYFYKPNQLISFDTGYKFTATCELLGDMDSIIHYRGFLSKVSDDYVFTKSNDENDYPVIIRNLLSVKTLSKKPFSKLLRENYNNIFMSFPCWSLQKQTLKVLQISTIL